MASNRQFNHTSISIHIDTLEEIQTIREFMQSKADGLPVSNAKVLERIVNFYLQGHPEVKV